MTRLLTIGCLVLSLSGLAQGQQSPPSDLAQLPAEIATLKWREIDLNAVGPLEYDRGLLLMNHVLDEIGPVRASEADLMSAYIEQQNLGGAFAAAAPPPPAKQLSYSDALKISIALLRGPMAKSSYATQLAGTSPEGLLGYKQMYEGTCQRRWGEVTEAVQQVNCMSAFLSKQGKIADYESWAKLESENRQLKYELAMAKQRANEHAAQAPKGAHAPPVNTQNTQLQQENVQLQQALASAQSQLQQQSSEISQQQQQASQQQSSQQQPAGQTVATPYYSGYGAFYAPAYYGAEAAWCHDAACAGAARNATDQRINSWHGAPSMSRPSIGHYEGGRR